MLSVPHLIVIFIVVLIVFGPEKLPDLARNFGKVMAEFRRATGDLRSTFETHMRDLEREADERRIQPVPVLKPASATPSSPPPIVAAPGIVPATAPAAAAAAAKATEPLSVTPEPPLPDPFLYGMDFDLPQEPEPTPQAEPKPEQKPEPVSDVGNRPA
jgi:TatA/E family protein of Tat protein translocase